MARCTNIKTSYFNVGMPSRVRSSFMMLIRADMTSGRDSYLDKTISNLLGHFCFGHFVPRKILPGKLGAVDGSGDLIVILAS